MHGEITTTTTHFTSNSIVNSPSSLLQNNDTRSLIVSMVHPHQNLAEEFINLNSTSASISSQVIQTTQNKIILNNNDLQTLKEDVSSVIINTDSNLIDENVIHFPNKTCDKQHLSQVLSQTEQEIALQDIQSMTDETSGEGKFDFLYLKCCRNMLSVLLQ